MSSVRMVKGDCISFVRMVRGDCMSSHALAGDS